MIYIQNINQPMDKEMDTMTFTTLQHQPVVNNIDMAFSQSADATHWTTTKRARSQTAVTEFYGFTARQNESTRVILRAEADCPGSLMLSSSSVHT